MNANRFLVTWLFTSFVLTCPWAEVTAAGPNILWITCEDISPHLGCYGDAAAVTPNLDRLAAEGVRYNGAFAAASVCSPARSCLITGIYPTSLGTQHLRSSLPLPKDVRCFSEYLRNAGYYCTNNVKEDYQFKTPPGSWDESSRQAHWRKRKPGQPFFSVFNITTTHQSQIRLPEEQFAQRTASLTANQRHDPSALPLPPYYPDTPVVRRDLANLYDLITAMDNQAGDLLTQLDQDGLADDTIVFFYSDHGSGLPRGKRWLHDSGIRVPLIVRFPKSYRHLSPGEPGVVIDRLVSFVDFAPTVLSLVGLKIPDYMEGHAFLGQQAAQPRQYVFAVRDRVDEVYEMSRAVRDRRFKYIRNYMPYRPVMQHSDYSERTPTRKEFRRLAAEGKLSGPAKYMVSPTKPPEELYDTQSDPHEIRNLADSPEYREVLQQMRKAHQTWMVQTLDTGLLQEAEMHLRSEGRSPYEMVRTPGKFLQERILAAADLVGRGPAVRSELTVLLADPDAAVRYWATAGLIALGPDAAGTEESLLAALDDDAANVRLAAAEALCNLGRQEQALPVIVKGLEDENGFVCLHAAIVLTAIGDKARDAVPRMKAALEDKRPSQMKSYVNWALSHALDELGESR